MRLSYKVKYLDGREVTCTTSPKDIVAFERQYERPFVAFATGEAPMEWSYYLAWSPLHRSGEEPRAFDAFLDAIEDATPVSEAVPAPFPPTPPAGSSPDSPSEPA